MKLTSPRSKRARKLFHPSNLRSKKRGKPTANPLSRVPSGLVLTALPEPDKGDDVTENSTEYETHRLSLPPPHPLLRKSTGRKEAHEGDYSDWMDKEWMTTTKTSLLSTESEPSTDEPAPRPTLDAARRPGEPSPAPPAAAIREAPRVSPRAQVVGTMPRQEEDRPRVLGNRCWTILWTLCSVGFIIIGMPLAFYFTSRVAGSVRKTVAPSSTTAAVAEILFVEAEEDQAGSCDQPLIPDTSVAPAGQFPALPVFDDPHPVVQNREVICHFSVK
ncbi:uncharacterized protein LOC144152651 [Haemaphysalis longicornis]